PHTVASVLSSNPSRPASAHATRMRVVRSVAFRPCLHAARVGVSADRARTLAQAGARLTRKGAGRSLTTRPLACPSAPLAGDDAVRKPFHRANAPDATGVSVVGPFFGKVR